jgi:hypothetical protein
VPALRITYAALSIAVLIVIGCADGKVRSDSAHRFVSPQDCFYCIVTKPLPHSHGRSSDIVR